MFFDRLQSRCAEKGIRITPLLQELGLSSGAIGRWKAGTLPNGETLLKLASRLDCSVDYLLGWDEQKEKPTPISGDGLTALDEEIIDRLLQLKPDEVAKVDAFVQGLLAAREA